MFVNSMRLIIEYSIIWSTNQQLCEYSLKTNLKKSLTQDIQESKYKMYFLLFLDVATIVIYLLPQCPTLIRQSRLGCRNIYRVN